MLEWRKRALGYQVQDARCTFLDLEDIPEFCALTCKERFHDGQQNKGLAVTGQSADHRCSADLQELANSKFEERATCDRCPVLYDDDGSRHRHREPFRSVPAKYATCASQLPATRRTSWPARKCRRYGDRIRECRQS